MMLTIVMLGLIAAGGLGWYFESVKAQSARWIALFSILGLATFFIV